LLLVTHLILYYFLGMSKPSLLLLGPGYIGGSLLLDLLKLDKYDITVYLRNPDQAKHLGTLGVKSVLGDRTDLKAITEASLANDIIINTLSSEDVEIVTTIGKAVNDLPIARSGTPKIFIHVGGGGVFGSHSRQNDPHAIYSDDDPTFIDSLPDSSPHRNVDLAVIAAHKQKSGAKIVVHIPTTVYGQGYGPFNKLSLQIPYKIRIAIRDGYASYGDDGSTYFPQIHVADVVRSYVVLLDALEKDKIDVSTNPYIIATNQLRVTWGEVAERIAKNLAAAGTFETADTKSVGKADFFGHYGAKSARLQALGWDATEKETVLEAIDGDVKLILAAQAGK